MKMKTLAFVLMVCLIVPAMAVTANEVNYQVTVVFQHNNVVERGTGRVISRGARETYVVVVTAASVQEAETKGADLVRAQHRGTVISANAVRM
jgi:hypothetical protein